MSLKVLVISDYRDTISTRAEAEIFIGLKNAGVDVTVITYPDTYYGNKFREAGIRVIEEHPLKKYSRQSVRLIRNELTEGDYDILHIFNSKGMINGTRAARDLPVKVVLYRGYHGNIHWYDPFMYLKYFHPRVDKITCLVEATVELFGRNTLFTKNKAVAINKGHNLKWYEGIEPMKDLKEYGIPDDAFVVVYVGNVRPMKGIPYLLRSTYYLPEDLPVHFLLIGRGFDKKEFRELIDKSPYRNNIHTPGYISNPLSAVAKADIFVLSSIQGEATTKSVVEAMSLGVPPVITDVPGNKGLVIDHQCGLVVPAGDPRAIAEAILKLYHDPLLRRQFGENARTHIRQNLNIETTVTKMKALYEELASERKREKEKAGL